MKDDNVGGPNANSKKVDPNPFHFSNIHDLSKGLDLNVIMRRIVERTALPNNVTSKSSSGNEVGADHGIQAYMPTAHRPNQMDTHRESSSSTQARSAYSSDANDMGKDNPSSHQARLDPPLPASSAFEKGMDTHNFSGKNASISRPLSGYASATNDVGTNKPRSVDKQVPFTQTLSAHALTPNTMRGQSSPQNQASIGQDLPVHTSAASDIGMASHINSGRQARAEQPLPAYTLVANTKNCQGSSRMQAQAELPSPVPTPTSSHGSMASVTSRKRKAPTEQFDNVIDKKRRVSKAKRATSATEQHEDFSIARMAYPTTLTFMTPVARSRGPKKQSGSGPKA